MKRVAKHGTVLTGVVCALGASGAACLTRPVEHSQPSLTQIVIEPIDTTRINKIDLLFMIDNSESMGDKQELLASAVPDMLGRLVSPNCINAKGNRTGANAQMGSCPIGSTPEFPPVHDMHIGILTSSLGGRGGDVCSSATTNGSSRLNAHEDDRGELVNRGGASERDVSDANPSHFLSWFPSVPQNQGATAPPTAPIGIVGARGQAGTLIGDFTEMVVGVHEHGCGFEAQNEAWYRFLIQPDPFDSIEVTESKASLVGYDETILRQRAEFLRPDSLLAVIVVTDENEEVANPLSLYREGWEFENRTFPGNRLTGTAPEGSIECTRLDVNAPLTTGPNDPNCTSCGYLQGQDLATRCPTDGKSTVPGYLDPPNDDINLRFFNQKQRFGVFTGYPTSRYVRGLTKRAVPNRDYEVDGTGTYVGDQDRHANCVNPIFATHLPTTSADPKALCSLLPGPRKPTDVYYAAIAGVPHQLLQATPGDGECPAGTSAANCPQKGKLNGADWTRITGNDPEHYDFRGIDFHMLESTAERTTQGVMANASRCPSTAADHCDPVNGREWATNKRDLQYACVFKLLTPKDCASSGPDSVCDCASAASSFGEDTPLCQTGGTGPGGHGTIQIYGKAYPSVREMVIARAMDAQGIVSSLCPIHDTEQGAGDPLYGYRPAVTAIIDRLKTSLVRQCLPQKLSVDADNHVPCLVLATLSSGDCTQPGLSAPDPVVLERFRQTQHETWMAGGGPQSGVTDPSTQPTCQLTELNPVANPTSFDGKGSCAASTEPGWCYAEGQAADACPQAILFTEGQPPSGATVSLECVESGPSSDGT